jgi:hypothetical protein
MASLGIFLIFILTVGMPLPQQGGAACQGRLPGTAGNA